MKNPINFNTYLWISLIFAMPLAMGGVALPFRIGICFFSFILASYTLLKTSKNRPSVPIYLFFALAFFVLLQLCPLPAFLLNLVSPRAALLHGLALNAPNTGDPSGGSLSMDVFATSTAALHQLTFALLIWVGATRSQDESRSILYGFLGSAAFVSLCGFAHFLLQPSRLFFLGRELTTRGFYTTFINSNHASSFLLLGVGVGVGLSIQANEHRAKKPKIFTVLCTILCAVGVIATGSRGGLCGLLALSVGYLVVTFARAIQQLRKQTVSRSTRHRMLQHAFILVGVGILILAAALVFAPKTKALFASIAHFRLEDEIKFQGWTPLGSYLLDFIAFGSGRGSFITVYPHYQTLAVNGTFTHPENILAQLFCELGVLGGLLACVAAIWLALYGFVHRARRKTLHASAVGVFFGLCVVLLCDFANFALETPAISLPCALGAGIWIRRLNESRNSQVVEKPNYFTKLSIVAIAALALVVTATSIYGALSDPRKALAHESSQLIEKKAKLASQRYPADGLVAISVASALEQQNGDFSLRQAWLERARLLMPQDARVDRLQAHLELQRNHKQKAALAYVKALEHQPWNETQILDEALNFFNDEAHLAILASHSSKTAERLIARLLRQQRPAFAKLLFEKLPQAFQNEPTVRSFEIEFCFLLNDFKCVERSADEILSSNPPTAFALDHGHLALAKLYALREEKQALHQELEALETSNSPEILKQIAKLAQKTEPEIAARALDKLWKLVGSDRQKGADALHRQAEFQASQGNDEQAFALFDSAYGLDHDKRHLEAALKLAQKRENHVKAAHLARRLND